MPPDGTGTPSGTWDTDSSAGWWDAVLRSTGANGEGIRLGVIAGQPTAHRSQLQALRLRSAAFNLVVHLPMIAPQERQQDCSMISLLQDFSLIISSLYYQAM